MASENIYNNELMDIASRIEKLKYEIIHGYYTDEDVLKIIEEKIVNLEDLVKNNTCNQLCLTELTDDEKENINNFISKFQRIVS